MIYVLRTKNSSRGFTYPDKGCVEAPDWRPTKECGNGLHGFARGEGDASLATSAADATWLVIRVAEKDLIDLGSKIKFRRGTVVFSGPREQAAALVKKKHPDAAVMYTVVSAGSHGTATAGSHGTATAGDRGTATAGDYGTATVGDYGKATAGSHGTATAGDRGTATAGYLGTATAGYGGTATAGYEGAATAGYEGAATAGDEGTATVGDRGTATAGYRGTATAGEGGRIEIIWYDGRYRIAVGYVGEDGIEANIAYRCNAEGKLVKA